MAKAQPPAAAPAADDAVQFEVGQLVVFNGYSEPPEEGGELLVAGETYEIAEVNDEDQQVSFVIDNPDFDKKKKANDETNPKTIMTDAFVEEISLVEDGAEAGEEGEAAAEEAPAKPARGRAAAAAPAAAPAKGKVVPIGKGKAAAPAEEPAEEAPAKPARGKAAAAPAPAAAKGKPAAKTAPAAKGKGRPVKEEASDEKADVYADLTEAEEDSEILALIDGATDILGLAVETVESVASLEYQLGGILFHIRRDKAYEALDKRYAEKGGFELYLLEQLNIEYRKAMYLVDIYYKWNKYELNPQVVAQIGWSKAAKIAAVMNEATAEELVTLAQESSVAELTENIKTNYKEVGGTKGEKVKRKLFKFTLLESSADAVEAILSSLMKSMNYKNLDDAFEHAIMEWGTDHPIQGEAKAAAGKTPLAAKVAATAAGKGRAPAGRAKA